MTLSDFRTVMRAILHDNAPGIDPEFSDEQLDAALTASYFLGTWPDDYALESSTITPAVTNLKHFGVITLEACTVMMVGDVGQFSFKTRALSETDMGHRKRDILQYARERIYTLQDSDQCFSTIQKLEAFFNTLWTDRANVEVTGSMTFGVTADINAVGL